MKLQFSSIRAGTPWLVLALVTASLGLANAKDASENRGQLSASDYKFARKAACGGISEVRLGKVAEEHASNSQVQQFGKRMVTDHGRANQDLKQIAATKGATLPDEPAQSQQKEIERLSKLSGAEFDKAYIEAMVRDHKEDVKEFKKATEEVKDPELKAFAVKTLAVIEDHLKAAEGLESSIKHGISQNGGLKNTRPIAKD